jgi:glycyl-tRNA synthetase
MNAIRLSIMTENLYEKIAELAKRRGFYWPSYEIYGGQSGFYTYGDLGTKLKRNIEYQWREHFIRRQGFLEIDAPLINPEIVFKVSGHLDNFKEYVTQCTNCSRSYRADHLIEEQTSIENVEAKGGNAIRELLIQQKIKCPHCRGSLNEPILYLTMFITQIGATGGITGYARPETAQGMFINFRRAYHHARRALPFALAQIGRVLRNEISPRRGMTRLREFTLAELELYFDPQDPKCFWLQEVQTEPIKLITEKMMKEENIDSIDTSIADALESSQILTEWQAYFMGLSQRFITHLGIPTEHQRFRAHLPEERAHYSAQTYDHEVFLKSWGWTEVAGHAYRTDYDLKAHQQGSGLDMTILRSDGTRITPHVVEPSFGIDRLFYAILENSFERRKNRNILHFARNIAPIQTSVFPLVAKDGLLEKAQEAHKILLKAGFFVQYDDKGSIGRRYARADEMGTPITITVDYYTLEDDTVTLRNRESWNQVRTSLRQLPKKLGKYFKFEKEFDDLGEPL